MSARVVFGKKSTVEGELNRARATAQAWSVAERWAGPRAPVTAAIRATVYRLAQES